MHKQYTPLRSMRAGFTIVELLIVIVVIAILATITIVGYVGMQDRAYAAKANSAVDVWTKLFEMYKVDYGSYPSSGPGGTSVCLGEASHYPAQGRYGAGECSVFLIDFGWGVPESMAIGVSTDFNNLFRQRASSLPDASLPSVAELESESQYMVSRGVTYTNNPAGGVYLGYFIKGSGACSRGERTAFHFLPLDIGGGEIATVINPSGPGDPVHVYFCNIVLSPPA